MSGGGGRRERTAGGGTRLRRAGAAAASCGRRWGRRGCRALSLAAASEATAHTPLGPRAREGPVDLEGVRVGVDDCGRERGQLALLLVRRRWLVVPDLARPPEVGDERGLHLALRKGGPVHLREERVSLQLPEPDPALRNRCEKAEPHARGFDGRSRSVAQGCPPPHKRPSRRSTRSRTPQKVDDQVAKVAARTRGHPLSLRDDGATERREGVTIPRSRLHEFPGPSARQARDVRRRRGCCS